jgi:hypothetical protein
VRLSRHPPNASHAARLTVGCCCHQAVIGVAIAVVTAALVSAFKNLEMRLEMASKSAAEQQFTAQQQQQQAPPPVAAPPAPEPAQDVVGAMQQLLAEQQRAADHKLELLRTELMAAAAAASVAPTPQHALVAPRPIEPAFAQLAPPPGTPAAAPPADVSGATPSATDPESTMSKHFMEENHRLQEQLSRLRREHWRRGLLLDLDDNMSPEEEAEVRRIFDMFDHNRNGCITVKEVQALHLKMGEPLTEKETEVALRYAERNAFLVAQFFFIS